MELSRIKEAADRFGTPLYLFDLDCIRDRVQRFRDAFRGEIGLTYSMKANSGSAGTLRSRRRNSISPAF